MGMFDNNPCMGCEKRHQGCHSDCEDGKAWKAQYEENKKLYADQRRKHKLASDFLKDGRIKRQRKIHLKEGQF